MFPATIGASSDCAHTLSPFLILRCLPNWQSLKGNIDDQGQTSPEDLRALNSKESMILTTNLSSPESVIPDHEVISDQANIKTLANLCESLVCEPAGGRVICFLLRFLVIF